ncbi:MAG: SGNH/GDSL hydrolase family protein [Flavitalea sp.]
MNQQSRFLVNTFMNTTQPITKIIAAFLLIVSVACGKANDNAYSTTPVVTPPSAYDTSMRYYLALGDSYTIGEAVEAGERYPVITEGILKSRGVVMADAEIIARTGWTTNNLQQVVSSTKFDHVYDVVTLLIGVNNQYQGGTLDVYASEFEMLLKKAIALTGGRADRVVVLSIPDYSVTPFGQRSNPAQIANEIDQFNKVNKEISVKLNVQYLDVTGDSRQALNESTYVASDGLHFSGKMYRKWAEKLARLLTNMFEKK